MVGLRIAFLVLLVFSCLISKILTQSKKQPDIRNRAPDKQPQQSAPEKDRLVEIFKEKLLEILNIKELMTFQNTSEYGGFSEGKITQLHNIPYPVLKEYENVVQDMEKRKNLLKKNVTSGLFQNDMPSAELELQLEKNKEKDDEIRFSSLIEEITLIPTSQACSENSSVQLEKNLQFEVLSCFELVLEDKEFYEFQIESAKMYFQLNSSQVDSLNYLFIEINDELVKKFNLKDYVKKDDGFVYEYVDLRDLISNFLLKSEIEMQTQHVLPKLSIKLLNMKNENMANRQQDIFSKIYEQFVLIVKFGDRTTHEYKYQEICHKTPNINYCSPKNKKSRLARSNDLNKIMKDTVTKHEKKFYDCDEVRSAGFPPNKCCRESIAISMKDIGWDNWIARPETVDFKYCRGGCTGN